MNTPPPMQDVRRSSGSTETYSSLGCTRLLCLFVLVLVRRRRLRLTLRAHMVKRHATHTSHFGESARSPSVGGHTDRSWRVDLLHAGEVVYSTRDKGWHLVINMVDGLFAYAAHVGAEREWVHSAKAVHRSEWYASQLALRLRRHGLPYTSYFALGSCLPTTTRQTGGSQPQDTDTSEGLHGPIHHARG